MKNLITLKVNRIFTFGCSFTDYAWGTWANILGLSNSTMDEYK